MRHIACQFFHFWILGTGKLEGDRKSTFPVCCKFLESFQVCSVCFSLLIKKRLLKFERELPPPGIEPGSSGLPCRDANQYTIWTCWKIEVWSTFILYFWILSFLFYFFKNRGMYGGVAANISANIFFSRIFFGQIFFSAKFFFRQIFFFGQFFFFFRLNFFFSAKNFSAKFFFHQFFFVGFFTVFANLSTRILWFCLKTDN